MLLHGFCELYNQSLEATPPSTAWLSVHSGMCSASLQYTSSIGSYRNLPSKHPSPYKHPPPIFDDPIVHKYVHYTYEYI